MVTKGQLDELHLALEALPGGTLDQWRKDQYGTVDEEVIAREFFAKVDLGMLKTNPLLLRSIQQRGVDGYAPRITMAWQAEAERLIYTLLLGETQAGFELGVGMPTGKNLKRRMSAFYIMEMAVTYLWRNQIREKAEMLPVPRHTIPENVLPYPQMYWSWEGARDAKVTNLENGKQLEVEGDGMLIWYTPPDFIQVCVVGSSPAGVHILPSGELRIGSTWPDDYDADQQHSLGPALAMLAFLNSPYISNDRQRLDRPTRRALAKASARSVDPIIHVVALREADTLHGVADGTGREFHHQWWVRGHIRAQWYASRNGHKLIWIREHLKGPNDAPIIRKVYDVKR